jgi:hypothetical protein
MEERRKRRREWDVGAVQSSRSLLGYQRRWRGGEKGLPLERRRD